MSKDGSQVTDFQDRFLFSLSQLSSAFGPARETIGKRLRAAEIRPYGKRGGHDVYHIGMAAPAIIAADNPTVDEVIDPNKLQPKEYKDYWQGRRAMNEALKDEEQLIPINEASKEVAQVVKICIRTIETLPDVLEMKCGLEPHAIELIERECDHAREDLAKLLEE